MNLNGCTIETTGAQTSYAIYNYYSSTLNCLKGRITAENGLAIIQMSNAASLKMDGSEMEVEGTIRLGKKMIMTDSEITKSYTIELASEVQGLDAIVLENISDISSFQVVENSLWGLDYYNGKGIAYKKNAIYVDGVNGEDSIAMNNGNTPSRAYKTLDKAIPAYLAMSDDNKTLYIMDTVTIAENKSYDGINNETSIIRPYTGNRDDLICVEGSATVSLKNFTVAGAERIGSTARTNALLVVNGGTVDLENIILQNNYAPYGGAIRVEAGNLTIGGESILQNNMSVYGGAIYMKDGVVCLKDKASLTENGGTLTQYGGAVYMANGTLQIQNDVVIEANTATTRGGGIYAKAGSVIIDGGTIQGNQPSTNQKGAAIYLEQEDTILDIKSGTIKENGVADNSSDDIYIGGTGKIAGNSVIEDGCYLADATKPLQVSGDFGEKVLLLSYSSGYTAEVLVQSMDGAALSLHNFIEKNYLGEDNQTPNFILQNQTSIIVRSRMLYLDGVDGYDGYRAATGVEHDGSTPSKAVKTFAEAKRLLKEKGSGDIEICNSVTIKRNVEETEEWTLPIEEYPWNPKVVIGNDCAAKNAIIVYRGTLRLSNLTIDGNAVPVSSMIMLARENNTGTVAGNLEIEEGTMVTNSGSVGIFINSALATCTMVAGEVSHCQRGGIKSSGTLTICGGKVSENQEVREYCGGGITVLGGTTCITGSAIIEKNRVEGDSQFLGGAGIYLKAGACSIGGTAKIQENESICKSNAHYSGGAGIFIFIGTCTIEDQVQIRKNTCTISGKFTGGGGIYLRAGRLNVKSGVLFQENVANYVGTTTGQPGGVGGGAIRAGAGVIQIEGGTFLKNRCTGTLSNGATALLDGGVLNLMNYSSCNIASSVFKNNEASGNGGAIAAIGGSGSPSMLIKDCTIEDNTCRGNGGGLYLDRNSSTNIEDTTISKNKSNNAAGGGIFGNQGAGQTLSFENCTVSENESGTIGGGAYFTRGTTIRKSQFFENQAGRAGGLYVSDMDGYEITEVDIYKNKAVSNNTNNGSGGGIYLGGKGTISQTNIYENYATNVVATNTSLATRGSGGGIFIAGGTHSIEGGAIYNNKAQNLPEVSEGYTGNARLAHSGSGGGIFLSNDGSLSLNSEVHHNEAHSNLITGVYCGSGGGIFNANGGLTVLESVHDNKVICENTTNSLSGTGGGIAISSTNTGRVQRIEADILNNEVITNNPNLLSKGGGISLFASTCRIESGTITGNKADLAGAIYYCAGALCLEGGNISKNTTTKNADQTVYIANALAALNIKKCKIGDVIYLADKRYPLNLSNAAETGNNHYSIGVSSAYTVGDCILKPGNGIIANSTVSDASQYIECFSLTNKTEGYTVDQSGKKIILSQVYFLDGEHGDDTTGDGRTPETAYKTFEKIKAKIGAKATIVYICGTVTISKNTSWSFANELQKIYRYTENTEEAFNGDMIVVKNGFVFTLDGISISGKKQISQDYKAQGSILSIEEGAKVVLQETGTVNTYIGKNESRKVGAAIYQEGILSLKGNVNIADEIYIAEGKYIEAAATFSPDNPISIHVDNVEDYRKIVEYPSTIEKSLLEYYQLVASSQKDVALIAKESEIGIAVKRMLYVGGAQASNSNDGVTPNSALETLEAAYAKAVENREYVIYIVDTVSIYENITLTKQGYQIEGSSFVSIDGSVSIKRYSKPDQKNTWPHSNQNDLFGIFGNVIFENIVIDGHSESINNGWDTTTAMGIEAHGTLVNIQASGTVAIRGNTILQNNKNYSVEGKSTSGYGGAILNEGNLKIEAGTIQNVSASKGSAIYQNGSCTMKGNPSINGGVYLGRNGDSNYYIQVENDFLPQQVLALEIDNPMGGSCIISYETVQTGKVLAYYQLGENISSLYSMDLTSDGKKIILNSKAPIYIDGINGNDTNDGSSSLFAVKTLKKAYHLAAATSNDAVLYIVDTVCISGNVRITKTSYEEGSDIVPLEKGNSIAMVRYAKPSHIIYAIEKTSNVHALFEVTGNLKLENVSLDGHRDPIDTGINQVIADGVKSEGALIKIGATGKVTIGMNAVLQNNNRVMGNGGAIENEGTLSIKSGTFSGNTAAEGAGVYQNGVMELVAEQTRLNGEEIYLAGNTKRLELESAILAEDKLVLDMQVYQDAREIISFSQSAIIETMQEEIAKCLLQNANYYLVSSNVLGKENTVLLRKPIEIISNPTDALVKMGQEEVVCFETVVNDHAEEIAAVLWKDGEVVADANITKEEASNTITVTCAAIQGNIGSYQLALTLDHIHVEGEPFVLSGYETIYQNGESLIAKATDDESLAKDTARLNIYSGYTETMKFSIDHIKMMGMGFEPSMKSVDEVTEYKNHWNTNQALSWYALQLGIQGKVADVSKEWNAVKDQTIAAQGSLLYQITLLNANAIQAVKEGEILLEGAKLVQQGTNVIKAATNISIQMKTEVAHARVNVLKNGTAWAGQTVKLEKNGVYHTLLEERELAGTYAGAIPAGLYNIYIGEEQQQGEAIVKNGTANEMEFSYITVSYEGGEEVTGEAPKQQMVASGGSVTLADNTFVKTGHTFKGWSLSPQAEDTLETQASVLYPSGEVFSVTGAALVFYAAWEKKPLIETNDIIYQISYQLNGGTHITPSNLLGVVAKEYKRGESIELFEPARRGYIFEGWYETEDFEGMPVERITTTEWGNKVFYAKWKEKSRLSIQEKITVTTYNGLEKSYKIEPTFAVSIQAVSKKVVDIESFQIRYEQEGVEIEAPVGAGTYDVIISRAEDENYQAFSKKIEGGLLVEKAANVLEVQLVEIQPGVGIVITVIVPPYEVENVSMAMRYLYKRRNEGDSAYSEKVPTEPGDYVVKIMVVETANYHGCSMEKEFTISRKQEPIFSPAPEPSTLPTPEPLKTTVPMSTIQPMETPILVESSSKPSQAPTQTPSNKPAKTPVMETAKPKETMVATQAPVQTKAPNGLDEELPTPKTNDTTPIIRYVLLLFFSLGGILYIRLKKNI